MFKDVDAINPGDSWPERLDATLSSCDLVVAVIGRDWLAASDQDGVQRLANPDDWVRRELEHALTRRVPVVPTLVGDAKLPAKQELPETLKPLVDRQAIELDNGTWRADLGRLVSALKEFAKRLHDPATTQDVGTLLNDVVARWQRVPRRARTAFTIGLGALVVILLGVGFVIHWLLIGAAIAALVWIIAKLTRNSRAQPP